MINRNLIAILNKGLLSINPSYKLITQDSLEKIAIGAGEVSVYKINVNEIAYVAHIIPHARGELIKQQIDNMIIASEGGYGPKVYYSHINEEGGICITAFLINDYTADRTSEHYLVCLAKNIKRMHQGNVFSSSKRLIQFLTEMDKWLKKNHIPLPANSAHEIIVYQENFKLLEKLWIKFESDIRPVHHDLNPTNILYDGKRLGIIDYETAAQDSLYVDLGIAANFYCHDDKSINTLLFSYFEDDLDEEKIHKFNFIRPFGLTLHSLWLANSAGFKRLPSEAIIDSYPSYHAFQLALANGKLDLNLKENVLGLSIRMFTEAIKLMLTQNFKEAIEFLTTSPTPEPHDDIVLTFRSTP